MENASSKYNELTAYLKEMGSVLVAFSGGLDSSLLLNAASEALGNGAAAVTVKAIMVHEREIDRAVSFCSGRKIRHVVAEVDVRRSAEFMANTEHRCYFCKSMMFSEIVNIARDMNISYIVEGSHMGDMGDYRPGMKALRELGIISPYELLGFDRGDIETAAAMHGFADAENQPESCLATRIPYGTSITEEALTRISSAEDLLRGMGFRQVRVRVHGAVARIEVAGEDIQRLLSDDTRSSVVRGLRALGFDYAAADLEGYRRGSMNIDVSGRKIEG